ncbi:MAG: AmmeMemoRadiSam system radical SAM enzyme [Candidatus Bruticola sp.]
MLDKENEEAAVLSPYSHHYWETKTTDGQLQCQLCPRQCILSPEQRGFCFIRHHINGHIINTSFAKTTGAAIDPIEKKPLYHFLPQSRVLSFGTLGCNMGCRFCQNSHITKNCHNNLSLSLPPQKVGLAALNYSCSSVAFTYNDPIIWADYAIESAKVCHSLGLQTIAVTAGYIKAKARIEFFSYMDAANIDLKSIRPQFYKNYCQVDIEPILDTIIYVKEHTKCWLELTNLIIPDLNDSEQDLKDLSRWIVKELGPDVPIHFSAFHPAYLMKDKAKTNLTSLLKARDIALESGLHYVYTGNIAHPASQSTYCIKCGRLLIERLLNLIEFKDLNLEKGCCQGCGAPLPGRFI